MLRPETNFCASGCIAQKSRDGGINLFYGTGSFIFSFVLFFLNFMLLDVNF